MQKLGDIRNGDDMDERESRKMRHTMIDKMLRNREAELQKYADLQRKLHAAEKIEICRRIRSGAASPSDCHRAKPSRSLSRGRYIKRLRRRRSSASIDDKDLVKKIEAENEEPMYENPSLVYNRLSTNILKYRYLHKLDDETLALYMEQLRRQLSRLDRFRQVSFGPFSVARHQNDPQVSWFFRRRSLPSLTDSTPTTTITSTTTTITSSITQSNIHEQPTLRSIQQLNQHRSRSSKPQSKRNSTHDYSHDDRSQSKRQHSTENSVRLHSGSRNVKSGPTAINVSNVTRTTRTKKSTPTEAKVIQKTVATTPIGRRSFDVTQKIKPKTDSELTDIETTISAAPKFVDKTKVESDERKSEGSTLNLDDEREVYSSVTSPESTDLRPERETISEKSVSPMNYSEMPITDEMRSQSNLSEQVAQQSKIENEQNSDLPLNLSPEILAKKELELENMETPLASEWVASDVVENFASHRTSTASILSGNDLQQMMLSDGINEDQGLAENETGMENKSERLPTYESSIPENGIGKDQDEYNRLEEMSRELPAEDITHVEDKMIVKEFEKPNEIILSPTTALNLEAEKSGKLPEVSDAEIPIETSDITLGDSNTFTYTEMPNRNVTSNETECEVNEFVAVNGKILEVSPEKKLKGYDSVEISEIYSADSSEENVAAKKNLEGTMEDSDSRAGGLAFFEASPQKFSSFDEFKSTIRYTEIEFPDDEVSNHFTQEMKGELATDQQVSEQMFERLSKAPELIPAPLSETSMINHESVELPKSEVSVDQLQESIKNEQEISNAEYSIEETETANGTMEKEALESTKDVIQVEEAHDPFIDEQGKDQEKNFASENIDNDHEEKNQQPDTDENGVKFISKSETEEKPESFATDDASLSEKSYPMETIGSMELQQEKKKEPEMEVSEAKSTAETEITSNGVQKINEKVLQTESKAFESAGSDSAIQEHLQHVDSLDLSVEESKTAVQKIKSEISEMIAVENNRLPEVTLFNPENLIIEGLTNNSELIVAGIQESQPFNLGQLENLQSDDQRNALSFSTLDTISSDVNDLFAKEYQTDEILNEPTNERHSLTEVESKSLECAVDSPISNVLKSDITSVKSNSEETFKEKSEKPVQSIPASNEEEVEIKKEAVEANLGLLEARYASHEFLQSEAIVTCDNLEETAVIEKRKYGKRIPKIVVCNDDTINSNIENLLVESDVKQYHMEANAETLHEQKLPEDEISKNEEVVTSVRNDALEELNDPKQSTRGQLNEFLEQYMQDMIQNVTQLAEERMKTRVVSEEEAGKVEIQKTDESQQHSVPAPECIPEFPAQNSESTFSKSKSDEALQKEVENVQSCSPVITTKVDSDGSTEALESCDLIRESMTISDPYHSNIMAESQGRQDNGVLSGHGSSIECDIPSERIGSASVFEEFSGDSGNARQVKGCAQELELKSELEKRKLELETMCSESFNNNMLRKYHCIISGLTANGQLILNSVSDSMLSSENKFISYFPSSSDASQIINDQIPSISDRNGNPELKVYDMQHIPAEVLNESNICAADVNANISALQETVHMKSIKHEQEMEEHRTATDEHLLLEQCNTGAEERETVNVNRE
uniref:Serine/arginine repetitive matrix protein 2 n=1 Tax=Elaeophora elaphi TaxID=1147741 RepID=A0A0R3S247_9BILA